MPMEPETPNNNSRRAALDALQRRMARPSQSPSLQPARDLPIAFSYLRVSTKEQARTGGGAEGYSIPAQRAACQAKAAQIGAIIQEEYVDAGESAKSADRDNLQRMLADIKSTRPDYVIVHKIDRLARNRADDLAINLLLKQHSVKLISCTENIDDTPSGKLLYGLMAEIAQFYSSNLAQEVLKGMVRKAEDGGTPFRAPLGYLNRREMRGGIEYSWVELDPERADVVRWCFEQFVTGEWSGIDLTFAAEAKGLTSRPTATSAARPIGLTTMYHILSNPYYMGVVSYRGIHYEGKHPVLVEPDAWLAVQDILAAHNHTGEKDRRHKHYLRSTIWCSSCGGRLVFSRHKGRGGTYDYFLCVKKKTRTNNCQRGAVRVERIEEGVAAFYRRFQIRPEHAEQIRRGVTLGLANNQQEAERSMKRAVARRARTEDERQKLLQAHYAGAIPADLLTSEMNRLTRALIDAEREIKAAQAGTRDLENTLEQALAAASHCTQAYLTAPDQVRRLINQGFFVKLFIGEDGSVEGAELTEPFATLLSGTEITRATGRDAPERTGEASQTAVSEIDASGATCGRTRPSAVLVATYGDGTAVTPRTQSTTPGEISLAGRGVNDVYVVELLLRYSNHRAVLDQLQDVLARVEAGDQTKPARGPVRSEPQPRPAAGAGAPDRRRCAAARCPVPRRYAQAGVGRRIRPQHEQCQAAAAQASRPDRLT
jgi:site-specific DNA recombinase